MTLLRHRGAVWPLAIGMIGLVACIAVPPAWSATSGAVVGRPLRKPINEALLEIYDDGTYEQLRATWFAQGK